MAKPRRKVTVALDLEICRDWNIGEVFKEMRTLLPLQTDTTTWRVERMYRQQRSQLFIEAFELLKEIANPRSHAPDYSEEAHKLVQRIQDSWRRRGS